MYEVSIWHCTRGKRRPTSDDESECLGLLGLLGFAGMTWPWRQGSTPNEAIGDTNLVHADLTCCSRLTLWLPASVVLLAVGSSIGFLTGSRVINGPHSGWPSLASPLLRHIPAASLAKRRARRGGPVGPWTQGLGSSHSPGFWAREAAPLSVVALSLRNWTLACPDRRITCMEEKIRSRV